PKPSLRLSLRICSEHSKSDGDAMRQRDVAKSPRRFSRDVLEMRCLAADNTTQCNDGSEALTRGRGLGDNRKLECARNPRDFDVGIRDAAAAQRVARAVQQLGRDSLVKAAHDN